MRHLRWMAKDLRRVTAVDLSLEMIEYACEKASAAKVLINAECADMVNFKTKHKYDMAALLMDSTSYLLTNAQVIDHLRSVASCLNSNGLYVLEMNHPKSVFEISKTTAVEWEMERGGVKVKISWGDVIDKFNPITQLTEVSVTMEYEDGELKGVLRDHSPQRCFTATEFEALVSASGVFEILEYYGRMSLDGAFSNEEKSWRMVPVLRKRPVPLAPSSIPT